MKTKVLELFTKNTARSSRVNWSKVAADQYCSYLRRKCLKIRKSQPKVAIGTCSLYYGKEERPVIICPYRLLERRQVFTDCIHLLTLHEPGNEFHVVPQVSIPGGKVDYFLASALKGKVRDFVGIELQTLDTTGTVWPERQRFLRSVGVSVRSADVKSTSSFGMNWKMTAKTALPQLHHKIGTFQNLNKHLVLVIQDLLLDYIRKTFSFGHVEKARIGDPMHIHSYLAKASRNKLKLELATRLSTDTDGISTCLGLRAGPSVELEKIIAQIESKMSGNTLLAP